MNPLEPPRTPGPHQNGQIPASARPNKATPPGNTQTVFPPDNAPITWNSFFYISQRSTFAGARLARAFWVIGGAVALLWLPGWLPGGQWVSIAVVLLLVAFTIVFWRLRRHDYVSFQADAQPQTPPAPMTPEAKVGVHVTGLLSVEGRERRYTWLPGFYRTFATREHALICHCHTTHSLGIGRWPEGEVGLWYVFFRPDEIRLLSWGTLRYGQYARRAIAVDYEQVTTTPRNERQRTIHERLFVACDDEGDAHIVWADLLWDVQKPG